MYYHYVFIIFLKYWFCSSKLSLLFLSKVHLQSYQQMEPWNHIPSLGWDPGTTSTAPQHRSCGTVGWEQPVSRLGLRCRQLRGQTRLLGAVCWKICLCGPWQKARGTRWLFSLEMEPTLFRFFYVFLAISSQFCYNFTFIFAEIDIIFKTFLEIPTPETSWAASFISLPCSARVALPVRLTSSSNLTGCVTAPTHCWWNGPKEWKDPHKGNAQGCVLSPQAHISQWAADHDIPLKSQQSKRPESNDACRKKHSISNWGDALRSRHHPHYRTIQVERHL